MERKVVFEYERDTKNKYRFQEVGDGATIGTLYVSKDVFDSRPDKVEVTLRTK